LLRRVAATNCWYPVRGKSHVSSSTHREIWICVIRNL
jgi:hypothetical protein